MNSFQESSVLNKPVEFYLMPIVNNAPLIDEPDCSGSSFIADDFDTDFDNSESNIVRFCFLSS